MGVGAVIRTGRWYFLAAFGVVVPVVKAVLLVGIEVALFLFSAPRDSKCADQYKRNLESASPAHGELRYGKLAWYLLCCV